MRVLSALAIALVGCAPSGDAWPGIYEGTLHVRRTPCDGGSPTESTLDGELILFRNHQGILAIDDGCAILLRERSQSRAEVLPIECHGALDGTGGGLFRYTGGALVRSGDELDASHSARHETESGLCTLVTTRFLGLRR